DGNLWFTEAAGNQIGRLSLPTHTVTEFAVPTASSSPIGISSGPNGTLWFAESAGNKLGEVVASPTVTAAPGDTTVTEGLTATFTAAADIGMPAATVQWQVSTNAG